MFLLEQPQQCIQKCTKLESQLQFPPYFPQILAKVAILPSCNMKSYHRSSEKGQNWALASTPAPLPLNLNGNMTIESATGFTYILLSYSRHHIKTKAVKKSNNFPAGCNTHWKTRPVQDKTVSFVLKYWSSCWQGDKWVFKPLVYTRIKLKTLL